MAPQILKLLIFGVRSCSMLQKNISNGKIYKFTDRLQKLKNKQGTIPVCIEIHLTMTCQQKCLYCTFKDKEKTNNLDYYVLEKTLTELFQSGCKSILWSGGGEPTLYRFGEYGLPDVLRMAKRIGFQQGLYTNGETLTTDMMEEIVRDCVFVRISIDAFTEKIYKKIHNSDGYKNVKKNVKTLLELKTKYNSAIDIGVSYVFYKENMLDVFNIKMFLQDVQPTYIYFRPGVYCHSKNFDLRLQKIIIYFIRYYCLKFRTQLEYSVSKTNRLLKKEERKYKLCYAANLFPTLGSDGGIYVCCHHIQEQWYKIGDIYMDSIEDVFTKWHATEDICGCPPNCRGDILNEDIYYFMNLLDNSHTDFL